MAGASGRPRRVAVIGCESGGVAIALAISLAMARPTEVIAGFDGDPVVVAAARRLAARWGVADRLTFEVAGPGDLPGNGYDAIYLIRKPA